MRSSRSRRRPSSSSTATIPESVALAKFYAQKRGIARDHLVGLACPKEEEISREDYDTTIARTAAARSSRNDNWWNAARGLRNSRSVVEQFHSLRALDQRDPAEDPLDDRLSGRQAGRRPMRAIGTKPRLIRSWRCWRAFRREISGAVTNPYFQSYRRIARIRTIRRCSWFADWMRRHAATVRRMITDAIETEKTGLWGRAYVDGAHNSDRAALTLATNGWRKSAINYTKRACRSSTTMRPRFFRTVFR